MHPIIPKGWSTWIGSLGAAAAVLIPFIAELADIVRPLGVPASVWIYVGAGLAALVVIGRMAQAVASIRYGTPDVIDGEDLIEEIPVDYTDPVIPSPISTPIS